MVKPTARSKRCSESTRIGRLNKARQFWDADILEGLVSDRDGDLVDAHITLYVHAGIAAADVICCARLGIHAHGQDHNEAITLLARIDKGSITALGHVARREDPLRLQRAPVLTVRSDARSARCSRPARHSRADSLRSDDSGPAVRFAEVAIGALVAQGHLDPLETRRAGPGIDPALGVEEADIPR